jgi:hypothetical protein
MYSKQYNWIQLCSLIFYFKYKNYNSYQLNSNHIWNWIQFHIWFGSEQAVKDFMFVGLLWCFQLILYFYFVVLRGIFIYKND